MSSKPWHSGGWHLAEVAAAQRALVEQELAAPELVEPYAALLRALDVIQPAPRARVLDLGCGVGHYGTLLRRHWPALRYLGTDASEAMIRAAREREPHLRFKVCEMARNDFEACDLVLCSQVLEQTADPWAGLLKLLRTGRTLILHRLRLAEDSHWIEEPTYAGQVGRNYLWSLGELAAFITTVERAVEQVPWKRSDVTTLIVWGDE